MIKESYYYYYYYYYYYRCTLFSCITIHTQLIQGLQIMNITHVFTTNFGA